MTEQRKVTRARTVYRGSIIFNSQNSTIDCLVRNFSEVGAKIIVGETLSFPQKFELNVPQKGRSYNAMVIWRAGEEVGIAFQSEIVNKTAIPLESGDLGEQLRELEKENAKLKLLVAYLKVQVERNREAG